MKRLNISDSARAYLSENIGKWQTLEEANKMLERDSGIKDFLLRETDLTELSNALSSGASEEDEKSNAEFGDFQTNEHLASLITDKLTAMGASPQAIIEPTCGKANLIIACLRSFPSIENVIGIEVQEKHVWQAKLNILSFFIDNPMRRRPQIRIEHASIFDYDLSSARECATGKELLIIGNPPWKTNSDLSAMGSQNLPQKSNFKQRSGLDALTGKSNFDIGEYITHDLLKKLCDMDGTMAFLVKTSVARNIIREQKSLSLSIGGFETHAINAKREFDASTDASLFLCKLNHAAEHTCRAYDLYTSKPLRTFGWSGDTFLSNTANAGNSIDGASSYVWRQGIKHDCAKVMEISREGALYRNGLGERIELEETLVYPLLKSSDIKGTTPSSARKCIIVTQKHVGQDTIYIKEYPYTHQYLTDHIEMLRARRSSIYRGKSDFAIFGVGEYTFKPYKIAISGLYKTFNFCLIEPQCGKPVMLDDTCYFIGFDTLAEAKPIWELLNSATVASFLESITFRDSKRMITKEVLMRIDLRKAAELTGMALANI